VAELSDEPSGCCDTGQQATCCEPSEKAECCGRGERCGCDAGGPAARSSADAHQPGMSISALPVRLKLDKIHRFDATHDFRSDDDRRLHRGNQDRAPRQRVLKLTTAHDER
jgi:hypothetical protein